MAQSQEQDPGAIIAALQRQIMTLATERDAALGQKAALAEVLKAISASPGDTRPVFDLIAQRARVLCGAQAVNVLEYDGKLLHLRAMDGHDPAATVRYKAAFPRSLGRDTLAGRAIHAGAVVQIDDGSGDPELFQAGRASGSRAATGCATVAGWPGNWLHFLSRFEVRTFDATEIALVEALADQAVIAIENTRLITEQREALEQQMATAEVLGVINASPGDLAPVFQAMVEKAVHLCGARMGELTPTRSRLAFAPGNA